MTQKTPEQKIENYSFVDPVAREQALAELKRIGDYKPNERLCDAINFTLDLQEIGDLDAPKFLARMAFYEAWKDVDGSLVFPDNSRAGYTDDGWRITEEPKAAAGGA